MNAENLLAHAERHDIDLRDDDRRFDRAPHEVPAGLTLLVDAGGEPELVRVESVEPAGDVVRLRLDYLDRTALDSELNEVAYEVETTFERLVARIERDGGEWYEVPTAVATGPVNCPECGAFMDVRGGEASFSGAAHDGLVTATCTALGCHGFKDYDDLERDGEVVGVLL